jgi:hypothetical protein
MPSNKFLDNLAPTFYFAYRNSCSDTEPYWLDLSSEDQCRWRYVAMVACQLASNGSI